MTETRTPRGRLRLAVRDEQPLQVVGAVNAYHAMLAERIGYRALGLDRNVAQIPAAATSAWNHAR